VFARAEGKSKLERREQENLRLRGPQFKEKDREAGSKGDNCLGGGRERRGDHQKRGGLGGGQGRGR